jgi:hypothetical protein
MWSNVSEERIASVLRVKKSAQKQTRVQQVAYPENAGDKFQRNVASEMNYSALERRKWQHP